MNKNLWHLMISGLTVVCLLAAPRDAFGNEATMNKTDTPVRPKGLRVLFDGNSWFNFVPGVVAEMAKAAGIEHTGNLSGDLGPLATGNIDVYAHGVHWWYQDEWLKRIEQAAETGLKANPDFRAYCHAAWVVHDIRIDDAKIKTVDDYNNADLDQVQAEIDKYRQFVEAAVDKMNGKFGKRVVFVVPVGDATVQLRRMVVAGKFPGVTKQSELWSDVMPHPGRQVRALSGYCHFAAIYRTSPVGLQNNNFYLRADDPIPITTEQHAILQKIAWDVVSQYPYAGIAAPAKPGAKVSDSSGKKEESKAPAPGLVPEQLKGWKATSEMPGAGIVTDYNDYIEKLPKAERPGVSDVKYYLDGNGQSAVAVLVVVDKVTWTHLLTYDQQGKRMTVQKFVAGKQ
jgi:hypothetical protein